MEGRGWRVRGQFTDGTPRGGMGSVVSGSSSAPGAPAAHPAPPLELARGHLHPCQIPAFPDLPSSMAPNLDGFASNAPANPFRTTSMAMGLASRLGLGHSGPCLSFATNPRQPETSCFFPLSLPPHPVPIYSLNSPEQWWPFTVSMCSAKPQRMDSPQATTSLPASRCPRPGGLRKSHLQEAHNSSK